MSFYLSITMAGTAAAVAAQLWCGYRRRESGALARNDRALYLGLVILSLLPYCLTMGLRYGIGTDYFYTYVPAFQLAASGTFTLEWGYRAIMYLVLLFTENPVGLFMVCAIFIVGLTGTAVWKESAIPWVSILLFVADRHFFISMNVMRQYMALAIVLCAFRFVKEKCLWKYAIVILIASLFHRSVLMFLPLGLLMYLPVTPVVGCCAIAVFYFLREPISRLAYWVISFTPYAHYYQMGGWVYYWLYSEKFNYLLIITVMASLFYHRNRNDAGYRFLYGLQLIMLFISFNRDLMIQADRISWSLEIFHLFLIPKIIVSSDSKLIRWIVGIICVTACTAFMVYEVFHCRYYEVYPYQSILARCW